MPQNTASLQTVGTLWSDPVFLCVAPVPWNENSFFFFPWTFDTAAVPRPLGVKAVPSFFWIYFQIQSNSFSSSPGVTIARVPSKMVTESTVNQDSQTSHSYGLFFSKYLSTCTNLNLISSCTVVPKKSILILHTVFVYTCDLLIIFPYVLRKCVVTWCPFSNKPVSCITNIDPKCRAHLQCTSWVIAPCPTHFFVPTSKFVLPTTRSLCPQSGDLHLNSSVPTLWPSSSVFWVENDRRNLKKAFCGFALLLLIEALPRTLYTSKTRYLGTQQHPTSVPGTC